MTNSVRGLALGLLLSFVLGLPVSTQQEPPASTTSEYVRDEVIVQFRPLAPRSRRDAAIAASGGRLKRRYEALAIERLQVSAGATVASTIAALRRDRDVLSAEPNFIRDVVGTNDPRWIDGALWGLRKIHAELAWTISTGSDSVVVASLDTGVNYNHPDLAANMWRNPGEVPANGVDDDNNGYVDDVFGIDTANNDSNPMDDNGHGTHTAGTIGAVGNNGIGVVGVSWKVKILPCKFIGAGGSGTDADAIECFNYIVALKQAGVNIRVTSNSWGSKRNLTAAFPQSLKNAIDAAGTAGIVNVFAAGNNGANTDTAPFDPASFTSTHIVSVAASDSADNRASFSNYGATSVDIAAPGVAILSTRGTEYNSSSGTSMAAPHVAGAVALLAEIKPQLTPEGIKQVLLNSVDVVAAWSGKVASGGRLNLFTAALDGRGDSAPTVSLTRPLAGSVFTAPTVITLEATATDADGSITRLDFFANGALVGTDSTSPYSVNWSPAQAGAYDLTAVATDDRMFTGTSASIRITVNNAVIQAPRVNVASAANGGTVSASTRYSTLSAASFATDGDRRASSSSNSWADGTAGQYPDWLQIDFNSAKAIDEIDIFTGQTNGSVAPTPSMTSGYSIADFQLQYWTGSQWAAVPGGIVTGNRNVWRTFTFSPITTTAIRVLITRSWASLSRIAEIEAYQTSATPPPGPATFEVGPSKTFATPSEVPWETITAGDVVLIHWRSTPYKNKWIISGQGTATAPIVIRGVPGPQGQLPVIDGNGATTRLALDYWNEDRAVIKIGGSSIPADTMPRHIIIENLDVRSGRPPYRFIDDRGRHGSYIANAAAITIEKGENITIRNNRLHDSGNGLFIGSGGANVSRDILIEGNEIFDNGNVGSSQEHNSYTEALGITFQYNQFGPPKTGSYGTNLKDRSAGAVVRYNWIDAGNRVLDFVDAGNATIQASSLYRTTSVYGNVLIKRTSDQNQQITHYGGDSASQARYRKGTLFFYNNTVVSLRADRTTLFRISTNDERVDARNNIFYVTAAGGKLSLVDAKGNLDLSHNWFKPGHVATFGGLSGVVNDDGTSIESASPGFVGEAVLDFRLALTSVGRNAGTTFATAFLADHDVTEEYVKPKGKRARKKDALIDLGAFEAQ